MKNNYGGWLRSLEEELNKKPEIDLAICFYSYKNIDAFQYNGTSFYPVHRKGKKSKLKRMYKRFVPGNNDEQEIRKLLKVIDNFKPDLIHVHGTEDNFGLVQMHTNIPVVTSMQGILNAIAEKYYDGINANIAKRYEGLPLKLIGSGTKRTYATFSKKAERERKILRVTKYIIGRTAWDNRISRLLAPDSLYFIGNEILRKPFYENHWNKNKFGNPIHIVTTSSDSLYKGFETIIKTAQILTNETNLNFSWKVIGLNDNSTIVKIVEKWKKINCKAVNIELLGTMDEKQIIETMLDADMYIQTSHIENSSNSLCEAMILGMPIIASFAGGSNSILLDNTNNIFVQSGDPYSLAGSVLRILKDPSHAIMLGNKNRCIAMERHNKQNIINNLVNIYEIILSKYS
jgi:glycosyltransferase involved in cell wall biosynthesis